MPTPWRVRHPSRQELRSFIGERAEVAAGVDKPQPGTGVGAKSEAVKDTKKTKGDSLSDKEKKELTAEEKEYKSKRKLIQEKLIKFATRIPAFMYLTDYRENTLKDVITKIEPGLFKTVTGLTVEDFDLLVSLGSSIRRT